MRLSFLEFSMLLFALRSNEQRFSELAENGQGLFDQDVFQLSFWWCLSGS